MTEPAQNQPEEGPLPCTPEAVDWWLSHWGRQEVVTGNKPLTREEVEQFIEVNGGTAEDLDLSERDFQGADLFQADLRAAYLAGANLEGADLREAKLEGARLIKVNLQSAELNEASLQGAVLDYANLLGAFLFRANLRGGKLSRTNLLSADLTEAVLQGANLQRANLVGANLEGANLEGVRLYGARIDRDTTRFQGARWGEKMMLGEELDKHWGRCLDTYRALKQWYQHNGDYETAGKFHYREWECKRKLAQQNWKIRDKSQTWRGKLSHKWLSFWDIVTFWLFRTLGGYGEHPWWVIRAGAAVIAIFALLYLLWGIIPAGSHVCPQSAECWKSLGTYVWQSLYFSGASFTALGYGIPETMPSGWTRYLGVVESLIGISMIALFLVTFTRKMTR